MRFSTQVTDIQDPRNLSMMGKSDTSLIHAISMLILFSESLAPNGSSQSTPTTLSRGLALTVVDPETSFILKSFLTRTPYLTTEFRIEVNCTHCDGGKEYSMKMLGVIGAKDELSPSPFRLSRMRNTSTRFWGGWGRVN